MRIPRPKERIDEKAKIAWRIRGCIYAMFEFLLVATYFIVHRFWWDLPFFIGFILLGLSILLAVMHILIIPTIRMIYWGYEITDDELDIQHGLIVIKRSLVPMVRIQHVDTEHGPIMRLFNLATLSVSTAGTVHKIPALQQETAEALRRQIAHLALLSEEDV